MGIARENNYFNLGVGVGAWLYFSYFRESMAGLTFIMLLAAIAFVLPKAAYFLLIVFSTHSFSMLSVYDSYPYWQLSQGFRVNAMDILYACLLLVSYKEIRKSPIPLLFANLIYVFMTIIVLAAAIEIFFGDPNFNVGGALRIYMGYLLYFITIAIACREKGFVYLVQILIVCTFILIYAIFYYLVFGNSIFGVEVSNFTWGGAQRLIIVSHYNSILLIALISMIMIYPSKKVLISVLIVMNLIPYILTFSRGWWVVIICGSVYAYIKIGAQKIIYKLPLILISGFIFFFVMLRVIGLFGDISSLQHTSYGKALKERISSIGSISKGEKDVKLETYYYRLEVLKKQMEHISRNPFFGYGFSSSMKEMRSADLGISNVILRFGLIGLLVVLFIIKKFMNVANYLIDQLKTQESRRESLGILGICIGLTGLWVGINVANLISIDFYTGYHLSLTAVLLAVLNILYILVDKNKNYESREISKLDFL